MADLLETPITVVHVFVCLMLILIVLIQPGKSGGLGAALGGAGAQQVFGGRGAGNFLSRTTWIFATIFFTSSVTLAYFSSSVGDSLEKLAETQQEAAIEPAEAAKKALADKAAEDLKKAAEEPAAPQVPSDGMPVEGLLEESATEGEQVVDDQGGEESAGQLPPKEALPAPTPEPGTLSKSAEPKAGAASKEATPVKPSAPKAPSHQPGAPAPAAPAPIPNKPSAPAPLPPKPAAPAPLPPKPAASPLTPAPVAPAAPSPAAPAVPPVQ